MATNVTSQERTNILKLVAGMFNAVPGATYLEEFTTSFLALNKDYGALATALGNTGAFKSLYPSSLTVEETATKFLTTLGLAANTEAQDFVQAKLNAGESIASVIFQSLVALVESTSTDPQIVAAQAQLTNKAAVAEYYSVTLGASSDSLATLQGVIAKVTSDAASVEAAKEGSAGSNGQTYMLTKGLDNVAGTAGNDTIIGSISAVTADAELNTFSALDVINGGAGVDTLKVSSTGAKISVGTNVSNVEVVEASSSSALDIDTAASVAVTNLNVTAAGTSVAAKASATTDINVTMKQGAAVAGNSKAATPVSDTKADIAITGGKNVTLNLTDVKQVLDVAGDGAGELNGIVIGGTATGQAAAGDVTVSSTGAAFVAGQAATLSSISVTGGKTINVTQKATSDASAAASSAANVGKEVTQGNVNIAANAATTTVTVKQDASVTAKNAAFTTGGATETATVKFGILKGGDALTVNGLTFTAKPGVDLTAAEVAAAFSNMVSGLANPNTDTQGSQVTAKGTFSGQFATGANSAAGYTAAAASGDTVVFTAARANQDATDLAIGSTITLTNTSGNSVAPSVSIVQGKAHDATLAGGVMGVVAGTVTVADAAGATATAVKTITLDGYAATGSASTATTSALETLNLSNGGNFAVAQAAATLTLNLTNVGTAAKAETLTSASAKASPAVLDLNGGATKTLNVKSSGTNTVDLQLDGAGTTTLNVSGNGLLNASTDTKASDLTTIKVSETAGLSLGAQATAKVTSVDTTGTTGTVTLTLDGSKAIYAGGAGVDKVTISNANVAIAKAIDLGAGDDTLTLNATGSVAVPTVDLKGGEGTDTIAMSAADAVALSANGTFAGKIEGFEKLSITNATATGIVNLANLDNINYVVSANSTAVPSAAVNENGLVTFQALTAGQSVTVAGRTVTVSAGDGATATEVAAAFLTGNATTVGANGTLSVSGSLTGWTAAANSTGVLKFTSTTPATNVPADLSTTISDAGLSAATTVLAGTVSQGTSIAGGDVAGAAESTTWNMSGLTNGQSYTIAGVTVTANKTLTAAEVAAAFTAGITSAGNYTVAGAYAAPAGWTGGTFSNVAGALTLTNGAFGNVAADFTTAPTVNTAGVSPVDAAVSEYVQGAAAGVTTSVGLTIDKMASGGTLELTAAGAGVIVNVTDAGKGTADVLNVVTKAAGALGTVTAADVETINLNITDADTGFTAAGYSDANGVAVKTANVSSSSLTLVGSAQTKTVTVEGAGNLNLTASANAKLTTVDASKATGALTLSLSGHDAAVTVTGGSGNDILSASTGANGRADVLIGGEGKDTLNAGSNGAKLTGGAGDDLFVLTASTKESNTYSSIQDFQAGDVLELNKADGTNVASFAKLTAVLNENTSTFSNFVDAAVAQANVGDAVWFQFKGNAYVVVDNTTQSVTFENGVDSVIELVGVDLNNASFNSTHATVALI